MSGETEATQKAHTHTLEASFSKILDLGAVHTQWVNTFLLHVSPRHLEMTQKVQPLPS